MSHRTHNSIAVLLMLSSLLLTGCGSSSEIELDVDDSGRQVEVKQGQVLVVSLESNPTTGYSWYVMEIDEAILKQIGEAEFTPSQSGEIVGAGGVQVLRFEAVGTGTTSLELGYLRIWEEGVAPLELFSLSIVVR